MRHAWILLGLVATAEAKPQKKPAPPTKAEQAAIDLAADWLAKLPSGPPVTKPFYAVLYDTLGERCPPSDNATCLKDKLVPVGKPHIWRHNLSGPIAVQAKRLADKTAIVVELDTGCEDTENQTLVVVKDKKVIAVMGQLASCSE